MKKLAPQKQLEEIELNAKQKLKPLKKNME